ncbi:glutathione S-transferase-like protein [Roseovarius sp. TM1035]|jgi:glutathione S-transferase|uniref:Glutathione S-transferase GST-6.0 n=1 Tax=Roseovarius mucosus TaxID=215743 RepID=A0A1V0RMT0_9RHOB|nr:MULTISPECIES: glutathione S-transferase [Roseovarius]ARE83088.1 glutathione S-transferase GST-6.0 [Roseovarius mucosus]AWZ20274.1 Glutathione S-transferase [Roseovarius sp. AK1035]EDM29880.1 glutathione S-transferase-like protein [Roseovarius sp. TM1035]MBW4974108.1 glutathione S-transferase [Roseovarius mucosus]
MKIYDVEGFPNPARVRIALAEKGAFENVSFIPVDVMGGEHRTEAFKKINPDAAVPCLELDDGTRISQCNAIIEYIDGEFENGPSLTGENHRERAVISMMNIRAETGLLNAVGNYFHHATPGLGPKLEVYQNKDWGLKQRDVATNTMAYLDEVLSKNAYVAGDKFSMADITVFAGLAFADFAKIEIPANLTNLAAWRKKMNARPSIAA